MDPFAEMALLIGSNFQLGYFIIPAMYDRAAHRYRPGYINDRTLTLYLSAQPGLRRFESTLLPGNPVPQRAAPAGAGRIEDIDTLLAHLNSPPPDLARQIDDDRPGEVDPFPNDPPVQGGSPLLPPPDYLLAYDWVVSRTDSSWSKHLIIQNPKSGDTITSLVLDGVGDYTVRMRVFFTENRFAEKTVTFSVQEKFLVGLGDSFASGEGNPDRDGDLSDLGGGVCSATTASYAAGIEPGMDRDPIWLEERAHRSLLSGQARAARSLQETYGETWNDTDGPLGTTFAFTKVIWASFARSGATIRGSLLSPQGGFGDFVGAGQIEECRRTAAGRPIDALLISIGGNDAGFSGVLTDLVKGDSYYTLSGGLAGTSRTEVRDRLDFLLGVGLDEGERGGIEVDLETLRGAVDNLRRDTPVGEVYLNGYPTDLFFIEGAGGQLRFSSCDLFATESGLLNLTRAEGDLIKGRGELLNALLARKADEFGWHFVEIAPDFAGHGYCRNDAEAMWVRAETSCRTQGDFNGTMHPNIRGHTATALRYRQALLQHTM
jgi:hypothetical protein